MRKIELINIIIIFVYEIYFYKNKTIKLINFIKKYITEYKLFIVLIFILNKEKLNLEDFENNNKMYNTKQNNIYNMYYDVDIKKIMEYNYS